MKARIIATLIIILAALKLAVNVQGQSGNFIISGADATAYIGTSGSSELNTLLANVGPRFIYQYANQARYYSAAPPSGDLLTLLGQVEDRFILQYANADRILAVSYPVPLVGDTWPPQFSEVSATTIGPGSVRITWMTDELATSHITYGLAPGVYTQTVSDPLFYKIHVVTLNGLTPTEVYYFKLAGSDRSGNNGQSSEYHFTVNIFVYLPLIIK